MQRRVYWDNRIHNDFNFSSSSDIIDQFNFIGYTDVCIHPGPNQLSPYNNTGSYGHGWTKKEKRHVMGGFLGNNQTGTEY